MSRYRAELLDRYLLLRLRTKLKGIERPLMFAGHWNNGKYRDIQSEFPKAVLTPLLTGSDAFLEATILEAV